MQQTQYIFYMEDKKSINSNKYSFGAKVRAIRKKKGITQIEFANRVGVTQRVVSYYENDSKNPSIELVEKIAKALEVSVKSLLNFNEEIPEQASPIRDVQKRLSLIPKLSREEQKYIAQTIDVLAAKHGIKTIE